ncbi:MAG: 6,7-dimethyl-8-ribityllumazine synthase [Acidimicrobiales bacterium]
MSPSSAGASNDLITNRLLAGTGLGLRSLGVADDDVTVAWVPGAFELPMTAKAFADTGRFDAVIALGCGRSAVRPPTSTTWRSAAGIMRAQLETGLPIVFGVLTTENLDQALARSGGDEDKGRESAEVAVEMVGLLRAIRA